MHCCLLDFDELGSGEYYKNCDVAEPLINGDWEELAKKLW